MNQIEETEMNHRDSRETKHALSSSASRAAYAYVEKQRKASLDQGWPTSFLRQVLDRLDCNTIKEVASILKHRYAMAIACTSNTLRDFTIKGKKRVVWRTGLPSNDGRTYAVITMPNFADRQGSFDIQWRVGRPRAIARIKPEPIPDVFYDNVIVPGHALEQSLKRSGGFVERDGVHALINNAIKQGLILPRAYFEDKSGNGAIQWLLPGQRPGIVYAIKADDESGHVFTATSLDEKMADVLQKTANPPTHRQTLRTHKGVKA